jgi:type I restriction enzyme M protein
MPDDIMKYESTVWATADSLIGAGIKQSDFPKFMMPFFALVMVESRLVRMAEKLRKELGTKDGEVNQDDFLNVAKDEGQGYNSQLFKRNKTLKDVCKNDKTFEVDFDKYLKSFDPETKDLLGIDKGNDEDKYLNISGVIGQLKKKKILLPFVKNWAEIDLKDFNNSEITTLEEHIKRKWADISAETAGEQYTPDDVITLISEIVASRVEKKENNGKFLTIYDSTCGGGNMLFGVEDRLKESIKRPTATYGQDWNDELYALAKIESRFRDNAHIEYGNTLTTTKFYDKTFDIVVANPPYGISWKDFAKDIKNDKTGRYKYLPAISDGQMLFMQHLVSKMAINGMGVEVHNGSSLFSGDAGSGESNIRKWLFDEDIVESIIQLPTEEFFNTGIYTYLWILNKNKPIERKDKIILINASEKFKPLNKSKGKKRKEVDEKNRLDIVKTLEDFKNNDYAKVYNKEFFYFNKQALMLTNLDENGKTIESVLPIRKTQNGDEKRDKSIKLDLVKIIQDNFSLEKFEITSFDKEKYQNLEDYFKNELKVQMLELNYKERELKVYTENELYYFDKDKETIIKEINGKKEVLGCGKIIIKCNFKKATKKQIAKIAVVCELIPDYQKDYEIVSFSREEKQNQKNIDDFMKKYIIKPFVLLENVVGVEINFNKVFYKPEKLRILEDIISDIENLDKELTNLESDFNL